MSTAYCLPASDTDVQFHEVERDLNNGALLVDLILAGMLPSREDPGHDGAALPPEQQTPPPADVSATASPSTSTTAIAAKPVNLQAVSVAVASSSSSFPSEHGNSSDKTVSANVSGQQTMPPPDTEDVRPHKPLPPPPDGSIIAHSPTAAGAIAQEMPQQQQQQQRQQTASQQTLLPTRRAACTHVRLTRIYGPYKCHHCGRVPRLGWVYRCTQDFGEDLVGFKHRNEDTFTSALQRRLQQESEARSRPPGIAEEGDGQNPESRMPSRSTATSVVQTDPPVQPSRAESPGPRLKDWMYKLREAGSYSEEQIVVLKSQRQRVLACVATSAYPEPPEQSELQDVLIADTITLTPGMSSSDYSRRYRRPYVYGPSRTRSTTIAPYWQKPNAARRLRNEIPRSRSQRGPVVASLFGPHGEYTPSDNQLRQGELQQPSVCVYQTCNSCRPAMRDRSWQCLHPRHFMLPQTGMQLPDPATDNRIMSHPDLIASAHYKLFHPELVPDPMSNSMYTAADFSDDYDDDDFDLTTSGYDSSEISPDVSNEGTPTMQHFDEHRGWDRFTPWTTQAPTPPGRSLEFGQAMPTPSVTYGNPLSGYGPSFYGQRRILRRASSMDPRLLRSAREMTEMADIGLVGLGLGTNTRSSANRPSTDDRGDGQGNTQHTAVIADDNKRSGSREDTLEKREEAEKEEQEEQQQELEEEAFDRSGAISALDMHPSIDEQLGHAFPAPGGLTPDTGEELHVPDGIAVTEEAVETGEADVILETQSEASISEDRVALFG